MDESLKPLIKAKFFRINEKLILACANNQFVYISSKSRTYVPFYEKSGKLIRAPIPQTWEKFKKEFGDAEESTDPEFLKKIQVALKQQKLLQTKKRVLA